MESNESEVSNEQLVAVHSMVRRQATRHLRQKAAGRHRFKQYLFSDNIRLIRNRSIRITWQKMLSNLEELKAKSEAGLLKVTTIGGEDIDLNTLEASTPAVPAPLPNPPLDSAANDAPSGNELPQFKGGVSANDPAAARAAERLAEEKKSEMQGTSAEEATEEEKPTAEAPSAEPVEEVVAVSEDAASAPAAEEDTQAPELVEPTEESSPRKGKRGRK